MKRIEYSGLKNHEATPFFKSKSKMWWFTGYGHRYSYGNPDSADFGPEIKITVCRRVMSFV